MVAVCPFIIHFAVNRAAPDFIIPPTVTRGKTYTQSGGGSCRTNLFSVTEREFSLIIALHCALLSSTHVSEDHYVGHLPL